MSFARVVYEHGQPVICHCGQVLTTSHAHCLDCGILLAPDNAGKCGVCRKKIPERTLCRRCRSTDKVNANGCVSDFHAENR